MPMKMYDKTIIKSIMQKRTAPEGAVLSQLNSCYYTHIIEFTQFDYFFVTSFWRSRKLPTGTYTVPALWIVSTSCCNTITTE